MKMMKMNFNLQSTADGDIIENGDDNNELYNQGRVYEGVTADNNTGGERTLGESNETVDRYVSGGKAEILRKRASADLNDGGGDGNLL